MGIRKYALIILALVAAPALLFSFSPVQAGIASSRIFLPRTDPPPSRPWVNGDPKTVELKTSDDVALTTLYWPGKSGRIIIFFHGNGGNQYYDAQYAEPLILKGDSLLIGAYRGYGGNPGKPSEQGLYSDGRAAIDFAVKAGYALNKIYLVGYSLGTGVALKLAAEYSVGGVITVAAFTDIPALAPGIVRFLISEKFDNDAAVRIRKMPLLMIHGKQDFGAGEGNRTLVTCLGSKSSTIELHPRLHLPLLQPCAFVETTA